MNILQITGLLPNARRTWETEGGGLFAEVTESTTGPMWDRECHFASVRLGISDAWHQGRNSELYYAWPVDLPPSMHLVAERFIFWICQFSKDDYMGACYLTQLSPVNQPNIRPTIRTLSPGDFTNLIRIKMAEEGIAANAGAEEYVKEYRRIGEEMWKKWLEGCAASITAFMELAKANA